MFFVAVSGKVMMGKMCSAQSCSEIALLIQRKRLMWDVSHVFRFLDSTVHECNVYPLNTK